METTPNNNYMKGFIPYAIAAAVLSLCGGFNAAVPENITTAWGADAILTFVMPFARFVRDLIVAEPAVLE